MNLALCLGKCVKMKLKQSKFDMDNVGLQPLLVTEILNKQCNVAKSGIHLQHNPESTVQFLSSKASPLYLPFQF
jgi:hypothetical protein